MGDNPSILALDPATKCGWALWRDSQLQSGTWDLSVRKDESQAFRLVRFQNKLDEVGHIDFLFFEAAGLTRFKRAAQVAGQLEGVFLPWAHNSGIPYISVKPTELKKWATGKGNVGKPKMIAASCRKTGYVGSDDDEAEARLILLWGALTYLPGEQRRLFEAEWQKLL